MKSKRILNCMGIITMMFMMSFTINADEKIGDFQSYETMVENKQSTKKSVKNTIKNNISNPAKTLKELIIVLNSAKNGDNIYVDSIEITTTVLVEKSVNIIGMGQDKTTLSVSSSAPRHFFIQGNNTVSFSDMTIKGFGKYEGKSNGGITYIFDKNLSKDTAIKIDDVKFIDCFNRTDSYLNNGGAIGIYGDVTKNINLDVTNSYFKDNSTSRKGGAIYLEDGFVNTLNSTFISNSAADPEEPEGTPLNKGGAIFAPKILVKDTLLENNSSRGVGGALSSDKVDNDILTDCSITVNHSIIRENVSKAHGGAIYNENGNINIYNSTLNANGTMKKGGAIYANEVSVKNSTLTNNNLIYKHAVGGGAIYANKATLIQSTFTGNITQTGTGAAIYINSDNVNNLVIQGSILLANYLGIEENSVENNAYLKSNAFIDNPANENSIGIDSSKKLDDYLITSKNDYEQVVGKIDDNGGNQRTVMLTKDSPARDNIEQGASWLNDADLHNGQRGNLRVNANTPADTGAIEVIAVDKFESSHDKVELYIGDSIDITTKIQPAFARYTDIEWDDYDKSLITFSELSEKKDDTEITNQWTIKGLKVGTTQLKATSDKKELTIDVVVKDKKDDNNNGNNGNTNTKNDKDDVVNTPGTPKTGDITLMIIIAIITLSSLGILIKKKYS